MLLDELIPEIIDAETDDNMTELMVILKYNMSIIEKSADKTIQSIISDKKKIYKNGISAKNMCEEQLKVLTRLIKALEEGNSLVINESNGSSIIKVDFSKRVEMFDEKTANMMKIGFLEVRYNQTFLLLCTNISDFFMHMIFKLNHAN